jgi:hypothetical protein
LHVDGRVNAADWDNVGTIMAIFDRTGTALVSFTSGDKQRTATKTLAWSDLTPLDRPEAADPTPESEHYFALAAAEIDELTHAWHTALTTEGIAIHEPKVVTGALTARRELVTHALAAEPPTWLTWWLGPRPTDPAGADIWDTELGDLAAWRDTHHLTLDVPGYGPQPDDPQQRERWNEHIDRSFATRTWLAEHTPDLPTPDPHDVDITAVRQRLHELGTLLATAPPDQSRIIADLTAGTLPSTEIHQALTTAADTQHARRDWILKHWPHIVEHAELARIDRRHDPLAHWPATLDPNTRRLLDELRAITAETLEPRTLRELDAELDAANPHHQLAALTQRQHDTRANIADLVADRAGASAERVELVDQHIRRLHEHLQQLEQDCRNLDGAINLWDIGSRPQELHDALLRRSNHLAHTAITNDEPWITHTVHRWAEHHPDTDVAHLHRLVTEIAAYRERNVVYSSNPLGTRPTTGRTGEHWQRLHNQINAPTAANAGDLTAAR